MFDRVAVFARMLPVGSVVAAGADEAFTWWLWLGISFSVSVTFSAPVTSPRRRSVRPGPEPVPMGTRPRRSGKAKVVTPSPP